MVVGPQHGLTADLGGAIEVPVVERMIFGHRLFDRIAIDGGGRGIHQAPHALLHACFHHVERAAHVDVERATRKFVTLQQPERRQVEHPVGAVKRGLQDVGLHDVPADLEDTHARVAQRAREVLDPATDEIVVHDDLAYVLLHKMVHGVRADETGPADYDDLLSSDVHDQSLCVTYWSTTSLANGNAPVQAGEMALRTCVE